MEPEAVVTTLTKSMLAATVDCVRELTGIEVEPDMVRIYMLSSAYPAHSLSRTMTDWWNLGTCCESAIERLMLWAMLGEGVGPEIQQEIGDFTCDFLLRSERIVIECDGHEFHTTVKRQARDRRIDRELQKQGYAILRFTGSQINADPKTCAIEVRQFIESRKATT